jgi:uridine kinase
MLKKMLLLLPGESEGKIRNLSEKAEKEEKIKFVTRRCDCGQRIFERSLVFIFLAAARDVLPEKEVIVEHSLSGGIYIVVEDTKANAYLKRDIISK